MSTTPRTTISLSDLRAGLAQRGIALSDSQLKRRRREGLVDVDQQIHAAGLRGSESRYCSGSVEQLELVERLARRERRFAQLAVLVRWNGGWVRPDKLRSALIDTLDPMSAKARQVTSTAIDKDEQTDQLARALTASRGQAAATKLMQRRLHHATEDIERTLYAFAALATHSQLEWENHDPENPTEPLIGVVERALGIDRARTDDIRGNGALLPGQEPSQQILAELQAAGTFDLLNLGAAFATASDEMIEHAFDDAIACADVLLDAFDSIQVLAGDDIAGLASLTEITPDQDAVKAALLVRGLLLMRPLMDKDALDNVVKAARNAGPQLRAARELARALPSTRPSSACTAPSNWPPSLPTSASRSCAKSTTTSTPIPSSQSWLTVRERPVAPRLACRVQGWVWRAAAGVAGREVAG